MRVVELRKYLYVIIGAMTNCRPRWPEDMIEDFYTIFAVFKHNPSTELPPNVEFQSACDPKAFGNAGDRTKNVVDGTRHMDDIAKQSYDPSHLNRDDESENEAREIC